MATLIGTISVGLTAKTAAFGKGMNRAQSSLKRFMFQTRKARALISKGFGQMARSVRNLGLAAAVATAALVKMITSGLDTGDMFDKMSKRTGLTVKFLAGLQHAANLGGSSLETMEKGAKKLASSAADASAGLMTYTREFDRLGVSVTDASGDLKSMDDLFIETVDALSKVENSTMKVNIAQKIFGRAGTQLLAVFQNGRRDIEAYARESEELGNVWNNKTAGAAAVVNDQMARVNQMIKNMRDALTVALMPRLDELSTKLLDWVKNNKELIGQKVEEWARKIGSAIDWMINVAAPWIKEVGKWIAEHKKLLIVLALVKFSGIIPIGLGLISLGKVIGPVIAKTGAWIVANNSLAISMHGVASAQKAMFLGKLGLVALAGAGGFAIGTLIAKYTQIDEILGGVIYKIGKVFGGYGGKQKTGPITSAEIQAGLPPGIKYQAPGRQEVTDPQIEQTNQLLFNIEKKLGTPRAG